MGNTKSYKIIKLKDFISLKNIIASESVLIIGEKDEVNTYDVIMTLHDEIICLITYYFHGIEPQITSVDSNNEMYIGINKKFYSIDRKFKKINYEINLFSIFYEFYIVDKYNCIVIFAELQMCIIDLCGKVIFKTEFTDINSFFSIEENLITVKTELDGIFTCDLDKICTSKKGVDNQYNNI